MCRDFGRLWARVAAHLQTVNHVLGLHAPLLLLPPPPPPCNMSWGRGFPEAHQPAQRWPCENFVTALFARSSVEEARLRAT